MHCNIRATFEVEAPARRIICVDDESGEDDGVVATAPPIDVGSLRESQEICVERREGDTEVVLIVGDGKSKGRRRRIRLRWVA